jgi:hypothetical protein
LFIIIIIISRQQIIQQEAHRQHFSIDYDVNEQLKNAEWCHLHDDLTYTTLEFSTLISEHYDLEDDVAETLCFRYENYRGEQMQWNTLLDHKTLEDKVVRTEAGIVRPLTINDIRMSCLLHPGAIIDREVNCNSPSCCKTFLQLVLKSAEKCLGYQGSNQFT